MICNNCIFATTKPHPGTVECRITGDELYAESVNEDAAGRFESGQISATEFARTVMSITVDVLDRECSCDEERKAVLKEQLEG